MSPSKSRIPEDLTHTLAFLLNCCCYVEGRTVGETLYSLDSLVLPTRFDSSVNFLAYLDINLLKHAWHRSKGVVLAAPHGGRS